MQSIFHCWNIWKRYYRLIRKDTKIWRSFARPNYLIANFWCFCKSQFGNRKLPAEWLQLFFQNTGVPTHLGPVINQKRTKNCHANLTSSFWNAKKQLLETQFIADLHENITLQKSYKCVRELNQHERQGFCAQIAVLCSNWKIKVTIVWDNLKHSLKNRDTNAPFFLVPVYLLSSIKNENIFLRVFSNKFESKIYKCSLLYHMFEVFLMNSMILVDLLGGKTNF